MAKKPRPKKKVAKVSPPKGTMVVGQVMLDLSMWVFDAEKEVLDFHAEQISRAFLLHFGVKYFGVKAFGFEEEE
jgi:hypothetical protein